MSNRESDHPPTSELGAGRERRCDVVVVGGGAAGLHVALDAADEGASVVVVSRKTLDESASFRAQGGLAAVIAPDDSAARHVEDTINAGRGLCDPEAVQVLVNESPGAVETLMRRGVRFDTEPSGELALGLEGGHSARRIVHAGGAETGRFLTARLAALVAANERIEALEGPSAIALLSDGRRCAGVRTDVGSIRAGATVLATGGGAALWSRTTNPRGAIGAGAALAHDAGADLADLEFCQFHPTALALPGSPLDGRLITEAVRGEGALLLDASSRRFTDELAARDQVTAAILDRMAADGTGSVGLDLRSVPLERFPTIGATLAEAGIDPRRDLVPVAPAAHYLIGGVRTDLRGRSSLPGLLAVGEAACTGLHGANRLASNSLSECFVFGARAARAALEDPIEDVSPADVETPDFAPPSDELREAVWRWAGPQRDAESLTKLLGASYSPARLLAEAALLRKESRGVHRRTDFPGADPALDQHHLVVKPDGRIETQRWPRPLAKAALLT